MVKREKWMNHKNLNLGNNDHISASNSEEYEPFADSSRFERKIKFPECLVDALSFHSYSFQQDKVEGTALVYCVYVEKRL
jgi:hypothetical protein